MERHLGQIHRAFGVSARRELRTFHDARLPPLAREQVGEGLAGTVSPMNRIRRVLVPLGLIAAVVGGCVGAEQAPTDQALPADSAAAADADDGEAAAPPDVPDLHPAIDGLDEVVVTIAGDADGVRVDAKLAADDAERQRGLMEVVSLPAGSGMLFTFDEDRTGGFWMRNTVVPLDIAYLDAQGTIVDIVAMDPCVAVAAADCPVYTPDAPYRAALEVPQGWFASVGVADGDVVVWTDPVPAS